MSTEQVTPIFDYMLDGQRFRTLRPDEYAEHIERSRAYRREHGHPPTVPGGLSVRWLGPYEKCERCGVPVVGSEHHDGYGGVVRRMNEVERIRTRVDSWVPGERVGLVVTREHECVR